MEKINRTAFKFTIKKGHAGTGFILAEYGFMHDPREMGISTRTELEGHINDILDDWEKE